MGNTSNNKKILVIANDTISLKQFRMDMLQMFAFYGYQIYAIGPDDKYAAMLEEKGVAYTKILYERVGTNPLSDITLCVRYLCYIRNLSPRIVFAYNLKPMLYGLLAANMAGVAETYALIPGAGFLFMDNGIKARMLRCIVYPLYRYVLIKSRRVFFQNPDDRNEFIKRGLVRAEQSIRINGSGVNLQGVLLLMKDYKYLSTFVCVKQNDSFCTWKNEGTRP